MFRKLKRTWRYNDANHVPRFKEIFPELNKISSEEMRDRFIDLGIDFYTEKQTPVKPLIRLTLPFAIILMILMLICSPILFIITGNWKYPLTKDNRILNWFRSLKLI